MFLGANNMFSETAGHGVNVLTGETGKLTTVARQYKAAGRGWVSVGDENYGEGSSREHAAMSPRHLGCRVVIARSFARIHETNLKQQGVLALTFANSADYDLVRSDDRIAVTGLADLAPGKDVTVVLRHADGSTDSIEARHTMTAEQIDPKITQLVKQQPSASAPNSNLTDREIEVLIRLDLRNKEIAEELDMKLRTVEKHIECILAKLKVPTRTAAALKAVQHGYVLLPKVPGRDPVTGVSHEQTVAELQAELAIANEHLKALLRQNELLKEALSEKMRSQKDDKGKGGK